MPWSGKKTKEAEEVNLRGFAEVESTNVVGKKKGEIKIVSAVSLYH